LDDHATARDLDREIVERRRKTLGEDHPSTRIAVQNLLFGLEQLGEASAELDALRAWREDHPSPE
jgi:hypothetical protein